MIDQTTVLQVSKYYPPAVGGIEQVVRALAEGLTADVRVLAAAERRIGRSEQVNGVRVARAGRISTVKSVPIAPTFPVRLGAMSRRADLVHYHLPNPLAVASHFAAGTTRGPLVATYHSDIVRQQTAFRIYRPVLERFLNELDAIIVTFPAMVEHSERLRPYAEKCTVVPLSVDLDEFGGQAPSVGLPVTDRQTVLFVGRLTYYKGVRYLVEAMVDLDADLLVVGDGERRDELERHAHRLGVTDRVRFLGRVSDETLHACYDAADVFVLPSIAESEAFGVVQLEAMAYRTPVVNTNLPTGVPWVSQDGETGTTVPPEDPEALAAAIEELLENRSLRRRYGDQAYERVKTAFSRERMIERTEDVYARLLRG
ncbi:glycosyltransferase [Natrinema sp. CGMCC1.2065]|uniref:glycosyltransferase n=1 Tax=Natrinema sp. CGMCC1.2065 TaxID=3445767 RepID=UPI003F4A7A8B